MHAVGPPIFLGAPGATPLGLVAFWLTFYTWVLSEVYLGWKKRAPTTASVQDRGSRWMVIAGVWLSVALGIALAFGVPALALRPHVRSSHSSASRS
jgi:hypothetical protein